MTILVLGITLLGVGLTIAMLMIFSGEIPFLCRIAGGEPVRREDRPDDKPELTLN